MGMETFGLSAITIGYEGENLRALSFRKADLVVVTQYGDKLWYIDAEGVDDAELLAWFSNSENIRVELTATSNDGGQWHGNGYLHPNERHQAAAIRGEGALTYLQN